MHAAVGKRGRHEGEVETGDLDRALPEVVLEHRHRIAIDDVEVLEHPGDGAVAKTGLALGAVDVFVDGDGAAAEVGHDFDDALPLLRRGRAGDQPGGRNRTSVDHRIEGRTGLGIEADRVERFSAGFDTDLAQDGAASSVGQRGGVDRGLGDRLDGEWHLAIAHRIGIAVRGDDANAEPVGIGLGELRDIGGDCAGVHRPVFFMERGEVALQRQSRRAHVRLYEQGCKADGTARMMPGLLPRDGWRTLGACLMLPS